MLTFDSQYTAFDVTPVSNQFILEYLPGAKDEYVKVYLYALMLCAHPQEDMSLEALARALALEVGTVEAALRHWEFVGLVQRVRDNPPEYRFAHPLWRNLLAGESQTDPVYRTFMENLYHAFAGKRKEDLHGAEKRKVWEWVEELKLPEDVVLYLVRHLIATRGPNFKICGKEPERLALLLADEKARSVEDAVEVLGREQDIENGAAEILRRFRQRRGVPSQDEVALYRKWRREWGFSHEDILAACAETTKGSPNFGYLDGILRRLWEQGGPRQVEAVREEDERVREVLNRLGLSVGVNEATKKYYRMMTDLYPHEIIMMAADLYATRPNRNLEDVMAGLESWKNRGLDTPDQVRAYVREFQEENRLIARLNTVWGGGAVRAGETARAQVRRWTKDWGFSEAAILYCAAFAAGEDKKAPMKYLNRILERYHTEGIHGEKEIAQAEAARSRESGAVKPVQAARAVAQAQYAQRTYTDRKPGEMPEWLAEMLKEEQDAQ